jgi:biotin transporter BioY
MGLSCFSFDSGRRALTRHQGVVAGGWLTLFATFGYLNGFALASFVRMHHAHSAAQRSAYIRSTMSPN